MRKSLRGLRVCCGLLLCIACNLMNEPLSRRNQLRYQENQRPTASAALEHPWFQARAACFSLLGCYSKDVHGFRKQKCLFSTEPQLPLPRVCAKCLLALHLPPCGSAEDSRAAPQLPPYIQDYRECHACRDGKVSTVR